MKSLVIISIVALSLAVILYHTAETDSTLLIKQYEQYKIKFSKRYSQTENIYRFGLYKEFVSMMNKHNSDTTNTWFMGINQFSDITKQQFVKTYLGENKPLEQKIVDDSITVGDIDWREKNGITAVKNQGQCGSCWAFSATAVHQSFQVLKKQQPITIDLSEQQLVDCSDISPYENGGCNGGYGIRGLEYVKDFGQTTGQNYPYKAVNQQCAQYEGEFTINGVAQVTGCTHMQNMINSTPLSVRVDATNWHLYKSGIFNNCDTKINHGVLLVASSATAWTIKNSWGVAWGENGFIRLAKGNTCAVCFGPAWPF